LARGLASSSISRGKAIRLMGARRAVLPVVWSGWLMCCCANGVPGGLTRTETSRHEATI
jgi:hypothetical protein